MTQTQTRKLRNDLTPEQKATGGKYREPHLQVVPASNGTRRATSFIRAERSN